MGLGFAQMMSERRYQPSAWRAKATRHGMPTRSLASARHAACTASRPFGRSTDSPAVPGCSARRTVLLPPVDDAAPGSATASRRLQHAPHLAEHATRLATYSSGVRLEAELPIAAVVRAGPSRAARSPRSRRSRPAASAARRARRRRSGEPGVGVVRRHDPTASPAAPCAARRGSAAWRAGWRTAMRAGAPAGPSSPRCPAVPDVDALCARRHRTAGEPAFLHGRLHGPPRPAQALREGAKDSARSRPAGSAMNSTSAAGGAFMPTLTPASGSGGRRASLPADRCGTAESHPAARRGCRLRCGARAGRSSRRAE